MDFVCGPDAYRDIPRLLNNVLSTDQKEANTRLSLEETYVYYIFCRIFCDIHISILLLLQLYIHNLIVLT